MIESLLTALRAEFDNTEVSFFPEPPVNAVAPSVAVYPGDPFLVPREAASTLIREQWNVRVIVSASNTSSGVKQMRRNSLKVRKAVLSVGAVWEGAEGPIGITGEGQQNIQFVFVNNPIHFRYDSQDITNP